MKLTAPLTLCLILATTTLRFAIGQTNMLKDPSFEDVTRKNRLWQSNGFDMERTTEDVKHGTYALKCTKRTDDLDGPIQSNIPVKRGAHYAFEGYVKLLNEIEERIWQTVKVQLAFDTMTGGKPDTYAIVSRSMCDKSQGWIHINGSLEAIQRDIHFAKLMIRGPDPGVDFLVDDFKLYEVPENPNWRADAEKNIDKHRKSNINLRVNLPKGVAASDVDVEVSLKRHLFPFGCMLRHDLLMEKPVNRYSKLAFYFCNWASIQNYKWKYAQGKDEDNNPDFSNAVIPTNIVRAHGMKVRGHSVFWDKKDNTPKFLYEYKKEDIMPRLYKHLEFMFNLAKGKLEQWDLQNEHVAGGNFSKYYERTLQDKNVTKKLFRKAKEIKDKLNERAALYLNEYQCVTTGAQTEQLYDLAMEYIREGVPIDGLGIQGHTKKYVKPDPTAMWRRLDRLGMTGLQLMMTEFDMEWEDDLVRADWFEDAIRAFFAHPKLWGMILWDFWEESMKYEDKGLVEGKDLKIVESGQRWACLVKKEWTTKKKFNLGDSTDISLRGFHGDYEIVVKRNGVAVQRESFTLGKQDTDWDLSVTDNIGEVEVPEEIDYVPQCISHREERSVAETKARATAMRLTCRTVTSQQSAEGENEAVSVSCDEGEVMTSCSSAHVENGKMVNGEKIEVDKSTGSVACTAYNGRNSGRGTKAFARCCKLKGLTCDYRTAGPSFPFDGAMAEARCRPGALALGCSAYSAYPDSDGAKPSEDLTSCVAQSGEPTSADVGEKSGVLAFSACCKSKPALTCKVVTSKQGKYGVECEAGYVMTGCNAYAESIEKSFGARIQNEMCKLPVSPSDSAGSTKAYAICCKALEKKLKSTREIPKKTKRVGNFILKKKKSRPFNR